MRGGCMNRSRFRWIGRWLVVSLLVAQFGAEIHLASHALADPADRMGATRSCSACLASSQLQGGVAPPPPSHPSFFLAFATVVTLPEVPETYRAPLRAFRSRAPPALA